MSDYDPNFKPEKVYYLVGQKAIVVHNGEVLLLKRSDKTKGGGVWGLPGGGLDKYESPEQGIRREIEEETQLKVKSLALAHAEMLLEESEPALLLIWRVEVENDNVQLNWEHDDYKWFTKEEAREENLTELNKKFISLALSAD